MGSVDQPRRSHHFCARNRGGSATFPSLNVVVRGTDNGIYYRFWGASGRAIGWMNLGGSQDRPDLATTSYFSASGAGTELHFLVRGAEDGIYDRKLDCPTGQSCVWSRKRTLEECGVSDYSSPVYLVVRSRGGHVCVCR